MAQSHAVSALAGKRAELAGQIVRTEQQPGQFRADLIHVDATIRLFAPDLEPKMIRARVIRQPDGWFEPGEVRRRVLDMLRLSGLGNHTACGLVERAQIAITAGRLGEARPFLAQTRQARIACHSRILLSGNADSSCATITVSGRYRFEPAHNGYIIREVPIQLFLVG